MKINEKFAKFKESLTNLFGKNKKLFICFIVCLIVIIILLFLPTNLSSSNGEKESSDNENSLSKSYAEMLENKISNMLGRLSCVSFAKVLVVTDSTEEFVYLSQIETIKSENSETKKEEIVYDKNGSSQSPIITKTIYPKVSGVLICINKIDASTKISIQNAVAGVLNIDTSCIFILQEK